MGPVKALREQWLPVKNPAFTVGGKTITFPCQLETEQYLEFMGEGKARLFDREGALRCVKSSPRVRFPSRAKVRAGSRSAQRVEVTFPSLWRWPS